MPTLSKQSKAQQNMGAGYAFFCHQTSWPLTFWPWKWCPSHVWRGLPLCYFSLPRPLCSRLRPDVRDRQTDRRQTSDAHHRLMHPIYGGGGIITSCRREAATICPCPYDLDLWPLTLKVVPESHVTRATAVPILVFLGLSVLDLGPMYATDRLQTASSLNAPT